MRILIAEHKRALAERLRGQLERLGHHIVGVARDGREAVDCVLGLQPDLVVMDVRLPVLNGIEATRAILASRALPIILITDYAAAGLAQRAREAGAMACLSMPVDPRQLRATIEVALARFGEFRVLREEVGEPKKVWAARALVEQAKGVLMHRLKLSEAEAFRWLQQETRGTGLKEVASTILRAEELLFRQLQFPRALRAILAAIRPRLGEQGPVTRAIARPGADRRPPAPVDPLPVPHS